MQAAGLLVQGLQRNASDGMDVVLQCETTSVQLSIQCNAVVQCFALQEHTRGSIAALGECAGFLPQSNHDVRV